MPAKSMLLTVLGAIVIASVSSETLWAKDAELRVGARPPRLHVSTWVHGEPVDLTKFGDGRVYVIDFWTTWCPPCLAALADRSAKQSDLASDGVVFLGVTNESPEHVRAFLGRYSGELRWRVWCDDAGKSFAKYVEAAGERNLPFTVVIDREGRVAWFGDPRERLADVVKQVSSGKQVVVNIRKDQPQDDDQTEADKPEADKPEDGENSAQGFESDLLPSARAVADLRHLHELLELNYAGYDDLDWKLKNAGEGWAKRTERFVARLEKETTWRPQEFYDVVREYLTPVEDSHFFTQGPPQLLGLFKPMPDRYVLNHVPYFAKLRLRKQAGRILVSKASPGLEHLTGLELLGVSQLAYKSLKLTTPYLYPTISTSPSDEEYLLGQFHHDPPTAPITVEFRGEDGEVRRTELPLHRSRALFSTLPFHRPFAVRRPPHVRYSTLSVRTMNRQQLAGLDKTAKLLSEEPVLILDLRGNSGGSDQPAMDWFARFSRQPFRLMCWADLKRGVAKGRQRWRCGLPSSFDEVRAGEQAAARRYAGRLFVLIDRRTASSGETYAALATQVDDVVFLGENSQGCVTYGNCDIREQLPNSRVTVRFGRTKFVGSHLRPIREGVGFLPDYWLDGLPPDDGVKRLLPDAEKP